MFAAACGTRSRSGCTPSKGGTLVIDNESGTLWACGFNPLNPNDASFAFGPVYEQLVYVNLLTGKQTPMLASSYKWSLVNKSLTFTIRWEVMWSVSPPFPAVDVFYTFMLTKYSRPLK